MKQTEAQKEAKRRWRVKQRAAGLCVDCHRAATNGVRCAEHALGARRRTDAYGEGHRVPTFNDFLRSQGEE